MKKIQKVVNYMRNSELAGLCQAILLDVDEALLISDLKFSRIVDETNGLLPALVGAISRDKKSSTLEELDDKRDATYKSILRLVSAYLLYPDAAVVKAAQDLDKIIGNYGYDLIERGYSAQSVLGQSFIADMKKPELSDSLALLPPVAGLLTAFETQNDEFVAEQQSFKEAVVSVEKNANATQLKRELVTVLNTKFIPYLRINQVMEEAEYTELCLKVATKINDADNVVKQRVSTEEVVA
ncbi:DUF6261 family protein [Saccharicrinis aurantiacus]|uniref:DUF6261 family protein n=1 Tax=Saccharicrinis aurantiacus TaxID=1849719 RepID=UPI00094F9C49|nr:DUF6261 family protein [Saccharicrinis aurantiacus]